MHWIKISLILCMFGCLKDFRPSESFITYYLTGPWKNFTIAQVNQEIYPVGTYSYFLTLVIVFLLTDFVRYKPIIIICGLSGIITFVLIILAKSIVVLQIVEFFYGIFLSTDVAYSTYIYAKVDKKHYQEVTGHTKAAVLVGRCMAGIVAQLTASFHILDLQQLNYLTVSAIALATGWTFFLPSVDQSIYFHSRHINNDPSIISMPKKIATLVETDKGNEIAVTDQHKLQYNLAKGSISMSAKIKHAYALLWQHFLTAYMHPDVLKWSVWWSFSTCGYLQVTSYIQLLWQAAVSSSDEIYNGAVDASYAIIGAVIVFVISKTPLNWPLIGDAILTIFSLVGGGLIILSSYSYNIWVLYSAYVIFGIIYHTLVTVASFEVAKYISEDSYSLIFGTNIFFALLLQSLLTVIVINGNLASDIRMQFFIYGCYYVILAVIFLVIAIFTIKRYFKSGNNLEIWLTKSERTRTSPSAKDTEIKESTEHYREDRTNSIRPNDVILLA